MRLGKTFSLSLIGHRFKSVVLSLLVSCLAQFSQPPFMHKKDQKQNILFLGLGGLELRATWHSVIGIKIE